jgi:hypothetical protein
MRPKHWTMLAGAAAMAAVVGGTAMAQGPGRMMGDRGWGMWGMWRGGPWERGPDAMLDRIEGRLAFIKAELKIDEAQTPAWNALADAVRAAAKHHNERMTALFKGETKTDTLPERLDAQERFLSVRLDDIKQIKGALNALYTALSKEQQQEADDIVLPMAGMGGGPMGGPHWWGR